MNTTTRRKTGRLGLVLAVAAVGAACDFEVTNPGPIHDANVEDPGAHDALANGAMRAALLGLNGYTYYGGAIVRDHHAGGHTGSNGIPEGIELGQLHDQETSTGGWSSSHEGRWIGEHMAGRIRASMGAAADTHEPLARFYFWAGMSNRTLGENACTAVFEGTGPEPYATYFTRAVEHFTSAAQIAGAVGANDLRLAALAGRASAHLHLGNWTEAEADASQVPLDFSYHAPYNTEDAYSYVGAASTTFRSITFWDTPFEEYFPATGDPRAAWGFDPNERAQVARATWGRVIPMYYPIKWYAPRSPNELTRFAPVQNLQAQILVDLMDGREMALVRAEVRLVRNDLAGGLALLDQVRTTTTDPVTGKPGSYFTGEPLAPVTAATLAEAWTALKFERLLELNMEGRRMGDRKRWAVGNTPGALHPKEYLPDNHVQKYGVPRTVDLCFPIGRAEKDRNPNIPAGFTEDPPNDRG